ncbi:MAG: hypothetical protein HFJ48_07235 [Clostridia bacterium]|jgi:hypothetical protein|nr:hypothetical protein [Clostridia bacterium]
MFKFCAILSLILVIAKIFGLIMLSWWLCLAPVLAYIAFWGIAVILTIIFCFILALFD